MDEKEVQYLATQGVEVRDIIAHGGYGAVFYAFSKQYDMNFALKRIPKENFNSSEIECLKSLDDPRFVRLYNTYTFENNTYLLMEYCPNDLCRFIEYKKTLTEGELFATVNGMVTAVKTCHDMKIAHCDIKPSNFMIDRYGRIKLGDFGLSSICYDHPSAHKMKGTRKYLAPEVTTRLEYNPMVADIWSLGIAIYYMAFSAYPSFDKNNQVMLNENELKMQMFRRQIDPLLLQVITRCLDMNTKTRPSAADILKMTYFVKPRDERKRRFSGFNLITKPMLKQPLPMQKKAFIPNLILKQKSYGPTRLTTFDMESLTKTLPALPNL